VWCDCIGPVCHRLNCRVSLWFAHRPTLLLIRLWRSSRREVALLGRHDAPVRRVDLSQDGRTLASCDAAGGIILWDPLSGQSRVALSGHAGAADLLVFSPDGRALASIGDFDCISKTKKEFLLWDVDRGRLVARPEGTITDEVRVMTFMDDGRLLAVVSRDARGIRTVRAWDLVGIMPAKSSCPTVWHFLRMGRRWSRLPGENRLACATWRRADDACLCRSTQPGWGASTSYQVRLV
jgi:hypothetical protein